MYTKEQKSAYQREWFLKHPGYRAVKDAAYYSKNRKHILDRSKKYNEENKEEIAARNRARYFLRKYKMTEEDKKHLHDYQDGLCYLCQRPLLYDECVVEHNHNTDEVRGLAHFKCNINLGIIENLDSNTLQRMLQVIGYSQ